MSAYTEEQKKALEEYIKNNVEAGLELSWYFAPVGEAGCGGKEDVLMPAASLIKIAVMIEAFRRKKEGTLDFSECLTVNDVVEGGSFYIKRRDDSVPIYELIFHMITESDNTCTNMLIRRLGAERINETVRSFGLVKTKLRRTMMDFEAARRGEENTTTMKETSELLSLLAQGRCVGPTEDRAMIEILAAQEDNCLLPAQLPHNLTVAHKTGQLEGLFHDCGIIYGRKKPLICAIGARNVTAESRTVWELAYFVRYAYDVLTAGT